ncbi:MAG: RDD family protein [Lewinellaceae bacterium]|nr:RDD family protein [Lewinella sp.]MCB9278384.1 RDD family protein [Lewinellaceae bacterium]
MNEILDAPDARPYFRDYAGFWLRFAAYIIDGFIVTIVTYVVMFAILGALWAGAMSGGSINETGLMGGMALMYVIIIAGMWLYFALMESSAKQATLGKMAVGIKVVDEAGERISFGKASGRFFGKIISGVIIYIGFIMAGFTERKQALHDMMAGTLVVTSR